MHDIESINNHLISRNMDPNLYEINYGFEEGSATFYLYNGSGNLVGYQVYRPNSHEKKMNDTKLSRYYTYLPSGVDGVFGLECFDKTKKNVYIVEGIFKAAAIHKLGHNAIAVLTNNPKRLKSWFRILKATHNLIAISDNDVAGQKLISCVGQGFKSPKDVDEMTSKEIIFMLDNI